MDDERFGHLIRFYSLLDRLERNIGGARALEGCSGRSGWPRRGVYFFRESGECRTHTGGGPRIVRVGTHALITDATTKLWTRLSQHKGHASTGGGHHRGSVFRLIVGAALIERNGCDVRSWGNRKAANGVVKHNEFALECEVSKVIGGMPFLWLALEDESGPESRRARIEKNSIALLSNYSKPALDPPSHDWLGRQCNRERVRNSGLWNSDHVDDSYSPAFLEELEQWVSGTGGAS